jgi:hypothetical protein
VKLSCCNKFTQRVIQAQDQQIATPLRQIEELFLLNFNEINEAVEKTQI